MKYHWKSILRRSCALCLATVTIYLLILTGGSAAAGDALTAIGENQELVLALVKSQLFVAPPDKSVETNALSFFDRLVIGQSPLLQTAKKLSPFPAEPIDNERQPDVAEPELFPIDDLDPEDPAEEMPAETTGDEIIVKQFLPNEAYENAADVYLFNRTSKIVDMELVVASSCPVAIRNTAEPQVLIIHSHGTEAYQPTAENPYTPTDPYRTADNNHNITRVGEEVKTVLEGLGIGVIHDRTLHDYPNYNGSYTRSAATIEAYLAQYPSIQIVLDIHRDAIAGENGEVYKAMTTVDGEDVAQVLLIVGTDEGGQSHDNWTQNLVFAADVQQAMNLLYPTLARPVTLRTSRFNQQYRVGSLLVEVGTHGNTLEEAIAAARHFARSLGLVLMQNKV